MREWQECRRHGDLRLKSKWDLPSWQADNEEASGSDWNSEGEGVKERESERGK